jgi:hypothetical protein
MLFDKEAFLAAVAEHCKAFNLEHGQLWQLAVNVFAARIRSRGTNEWSTVYYFNNQEVKLRDKQNRKWQMEPAVRLHLLSGFVSGPISPDPDDHRRAWCFNIEVIGDRSESVRRYAINLFVAHEDNSEIEWLREAEPISLIAEAA